MISGQMIVYFFQKSKMFKLGIGLLCLIIILYAYFVGNQLARDQETLQILKLSQKKYIAPVQSQEVIQMGGKEEYVFVASSRGKYYYPKSCSRAKTLSIKNMLYYKDKTTAEAAGYIEYSRC